MGGTSRTWFAPRTLFLLLCATPTLGLPSSNATLRDDLIPQWQTLSARQQSPGIAPGIDLRILAIGDSITEGGSEDKGNSYRLKLREQLVKDTSRTVDFIGSRENGQGNADNQHEGYGGKRISEIQSNLVAFGAMSQRPNVVLIHAGTNDMLQDPAAESYDGAPARLGNLIEKVLCACPDAVVLVAKIIKSGMPGRQARNDAFNSQIPGVVGKFYAKGYKVRTVDHSSIGGDYLPDGIHPNPSGYTIMSALWLGALGGLPSGWITKPQQGAAAPPSGFPGKGVETCKSDKWGWGPVNSDREICPGASVPGDRGEPTPAATVTFSPGFKAPVNVAGGIGKESTGLTFGDLNGDGKSDYLYVNSDGSVIAYLNNGVPNWQVVNNGNPIAHGIGPRAGIRFADMTGDGKDDIVVFHTDGRMMIHRNQGPFGVSWAWSDLPIVSPGGTMQGNELLGDLNGDGKADVAVIQFDGSISLHIQQGEIGTASFSWKTCKNQGTAHGNPNLRLEDINGDGRADLISIDNDGGLKGWLNKPGGDCGVFWDPIRNSNGMEKAIAAGAGGPASRIRLADLTGDGKADYLVVNAASSAVEMFENTGLTLSNTKNNVLYGLGAGVRLADLDGDGKDDYIAVGPNGEAVAFKNTGQVGNGGWAFWPMQEGAKIALGNPNWRRNQIHFADLDGDGLADYIRVDDTTGAITWQRNKGPYGTNSWWWTPAREIASGVGPGAGARFADIDGDGRADFIYVNEKGDATVFPNNGVRGDDFNGWGELNGGKPVAQGVNAKREEVYFADLDGDGFADYIRVFEATGAMEVFYGARPLSGPGWNWFPGGKKADGAGYPGKHVRFARMAPSGRADYVIVEEATGALKMFENVCREAIAKGGGGGTTPTGCGAAPLPSPTGTDGGPTEPAPVPPQPDPFPGFRFNLTLINATPYVWRRDWVHSSEMPLWDTIWPAYILPGQTMTASYGTNMGDDHAGDVKYRLDIFGQTTKGFHIQAHGSRETNKDGMDTFVTLFGGLAPQDHATQDVPWRIGTYLHDNRRGSEGGADSWILSGSEETGYTCTDPRTQWMDSMGPRLKKLSLTQIVLPASHDSGMDRLDPADGGVFDNTGTQSVPIYEQLVRGIRVLDFRVYWYNSDFKLGHFSGAGGGFGQSVASAVDDINRFNAQNPGEFILIQINQLARPRTNPMEPAMIRAFISTLERILDGASQTYQLTSTGSDISGEPLQTYFNARRSPVLVSFKWDLVSGVWERSVSNRQTKAFVTDQNLKFNGSYADSMDGPTMRDDQHRKLKGRGKNDIFETSFTLTLKDVANVAVWDVSIATLSTTAAGVMYDSLWRWAQDHQVWPNIIWYDFVDDRQVAGIAMAIIANFAYRAAGV